MKEKMDILSFDLPELTEKIIAMGEAPFRAKQIFSWLHEKRVTTFREMSTLSRKLRETLDDTFYINRLCAVRVLSSQKDGTVKYLYRLPDGEFVETVCMMYHHGRSLCISTQVGCRMGCAFCASTIAGFVRNLTPSEMLLQVYETCRNCGERIDRIVLMGIGEPLDNMENVLKFFHILSDPNGYGMSLRHVSLSTCGLVPEIRKLAQLHLGLTLSVSLHSAENARRSEIMPINRRYPIAEVMDACRYYFQETGRRVTLEYAVIEGVNSAREDAETLAQLIHGMGCHVNLIPVNAVTERDFHATRQAAEKFQRWLIERGVNATIRRTLGDDISAACGQLRRDAETRKETQGKGVENR